MTRVSLIGLFFSVFLVVGWSLESQAHIDATCFEGDCLKYGWESYDRWNGREGSVSCNEENCKESGWGVYINSRLYAEVDCREGGCFQEGWLVYDARSSRLVSSVRCLMDSRDEDAENCLTMGWEVFEPGYGRTQVRCLNSDCRQFGWNTFYPNGAVERLRCKRGGCFNKGWTIYR